MIPVDMRDESSAGKHECATCSLLEYRLMMYGIQMEATPIVGEVFLDGSRIPSAEPLCGVA